METKNKAKTLVNRIEASCKEWSVIPSSELMTYAAACDAYAAGDLTSDQMQDSICDYMDNTAGRMRALSAALGRIKEPPLADVFTEATNMLVDAIVRSSALANKNLTVYSEKNLRLPMGGYRKPDVSIWRGDKLVAAVECKTCLGHRRNDWLADYDKRVVEFGSLGLPAEALILFVETEQTWYGFPATDKRTLKSWFTLCPKGAWHGGGKTGEIKLRLKQNKDIVEMLRKAIVNIVNAAGV